MACILMPECNFMHGYFRCLLWEETVDMEVKVKMMRGIHTLRRDCTTQVMSCKLWSPRLCPYPSLITKMQTYLELEGKLGNQLCTRTYQLSKTTPLQKAPIPKSTAEKKKRKKNTHEEVIQGKTDQKVFTRIKGNCHYSDLYTNFSGEANNHCCQT